MISTSMFSSNGGLGKSKRRSKDEDNLSDEDARIVDSLPDFTLAEDIEVQDLEEQKRKAMMGDAGSVASRAETSVSGISRDKSLEQDFEFEEVSAPLPKPKEILQKKRKKGRRLNKALREGGGGADDDSRSFNERFTPPEAPADEDLDPISRLRRSITKGDESSGVGWFDLSDLSFVKVIENATWFGIACLVLWEVYINSPFFERAAPMAPVVY